MNDSLYTVGGEGFPEIQVERYSATTDTWTAVPGIRSCGGLVGAATLDDQLYTLQVLAVGVRFLLI